MLRSLYTASTGMSAQQHNLDVIANNLANVNTNGFKSQRAEFQDLMYETLRGAGGESGKDRPEAIQIGAGVKIGATAGSFKDGVIQNTDNPLDVAIMGDGFFKLTGPEGSSVYTRDGAFQLNAEGNLTNVDGLLLDPTIHIPTEATAVTINAQGFVKGLVDGDTQDFGQIKVSTVANPAGMSRIGGNLFVPTAASGEIAEKTPGEQGSGQLQSEHLEGSNVAVVEEMTRMITAQRAYEINSKAIQTADDMLGIVNNLKR